MSDDVVYAETVRDYVASHSASATMRFSIVLRIELLGIGSVDTIPCIANSRTTVGDINVQFLTVWFRLHNRPVDSCSQLVLFKDASCSAQWDTSNHAAPFIMSWLMFCGGKSPLHVRVTFVAPKREPSTSVPVPSVRPPAPAPAVRPPPTPSPAPAARPATSSSTVSRSKKMSEEEEQLLKVYREAYRYYQIKRVDVPHTVRSTVYELVRDYIRQQSDYPSPSTAYPTFRQEQLQQMIGESDDESDVVQ